MKRLKQIVAGSFVSLFGLLILWGGMFFFAPKFAAQVYLYPGFILMPLSVIIPNDVTYYMYPDGGAEAAVGDAFLFASMFWWLAGTVIAYLMLRKAGKLGTTHCL